MRTYRRFVPTRLSAVLASLLIAATAGNSACTAQGDSSAVAGRWWKGNLHTHSLWSDGDHYPEMVADWYKSHGYHFLSLTDHNRLSEGTYWKEVDKAAAGEKALEACRKRFGKDHVEARTQSGKLVIRLKTLEEIRPMFDEPGRFCLIQGEEITDTYGKKPAKAATVPVKETPVHVNGINLKQRIRPQNGKSIVDTIKRNVLAVERQAEKVGRPMLAILNHPNWKQSLTAEDILAVPCVGFFELYNGGTDVRNFGDAQQAGTERVWDIVLTKRVADGAGPLLYGVGADDTHQVAVMDSNEAIPGRAWVMVRSETLSPDAIVAAMKAGDFYTSTGVVLKDVRFDGKTLRIVIEPQDGVSYTTQFIGSKRGCDLNSTPVTDEAGKPLRATRRYSRDIGRVLAEVKGASPSYSLAGDELYVRAKVVSSKPHPYPHAKGETEAAWTQPFVPKGAK